MLLKIADEYRPKSSREACVGCTGAETVFYICPFLCIFIQYLVLLKVRDKQTRPTAPSPELALYYIVSTWNNL